MVNLQRPTMLNFLSSGCLFSQLSKTFTENRGFNQDEIIGMNRIYLSETYFWGQVHINHEIPRELIVGDHVFNSHDLPA